MRSYSLVLVALVTLLLAFVNGIPAPPDPNAAGLPDLHIPQSKSTVSVRIIDKTSLVQGIPLSIFLEPQIEGFTSLKAPAYSFLIEHASGRKVVFDLGVRADPLNLAPFWSDRIVNGS